MADWDGARPSSGALDVAYRRALDAEVDRYNDYAFDVILCDFTKLLDTLDLEVLINEAVALGFHPQMSAWGCAYTSRIGAS